jgi:uncharacterized protein (DUF433 family)
MKRERCDTEPGKRLDERLRDVIGVICSSERTNRCQVEERMTVLGRYIVADPAICHGKPTFKGTRIFVAQVLDQVAEGLAWETIAESWGGAISQDEIAEAVRLSRDAFLSQDLARSG